MHSLWQGRKKRPTGGWPVGLGEERLLFCSRAAGLRPCPKQIPPDRRQPRAASGLRVLDERRHPVLDRVLSLADTLRDLGAVLLQRPLDVAAALGQVAADPVAGRPRALGRLAAGAGALALELVELAGDLRAEALQLALGGRP